jgi:hypothetical protein
MLRRSNYWVGGHTHFFMKAILRSSLLAVVLLAPAVQAAPEVHDRVYETLYKNPKASKSYREGYAGHYVRKDRPYRFVTFYERTSIPRSYAGNRDYYVGPGSRRFHGVGTYYYNVPGYPKPQVMISSRRPDGFDPYRYHGSYYHGAAAGTSHHVHSR